LAEHGFLDKPADGFNGLDELNIHYRGRVAAAVLERTERGNFLPLFPQFVFGAGNAPSKVVLIGEAPGGEEVKAGVPFVGQAGKILTGQLIGAGLDRNELYITNAIKYRLAKYGKRPGTLANRPATSFDIEVCREWLEAELKYVGPELVITLGKTAFDSAFTVLESICKALAANGTAVTAEAVRSAPMGEIHGNKYRGTTEEGRQLMLIPLYHPASLIYNRDLEPAFRADMTEVEKCVSLI